MTELWNLLIQFPALDAAMLGEYPPATILAALFVTTFLTEDGACLLAGALAASGAIGLELAIASCFAGIFVGDVGLYLIGRGFGNSIKRSRLFSRFVSKKSVERASHWLEKRGLAAIFISRFVTGLRLPTYLAAGFLKVDLLRFTLFFLLAALVWTPLLVGSAYLAQDLLFGSNFLLGAIFLFAAVKTAFIVADRRRRRYAYGRLQRIYRWEFWPIQVFYAPVLAYAIYRGVRHGSLTVFTCANPAIPSGGFVGESKDDIYQGLARSPAAASFLLRHLSFDPSELGPKGERNAGEILEMAGFPLPAVLKPDKGERGRDVRMIRTLEALNDALNEIEGEHIIQEMAEGDEFSVFYYRRPGEPAGSVFSVTEKTFPVVEGDGKSTIEDLVLADERAVCIAATYLENLDDDPDRVPEKGETVRLLEIGTHARGAVFCDGGRIRTPELESAIDLICRGYEGFYFGRFDLRAGTVEDLKQGKGFKIVELNGVTSESTNIYDRKFSLFDAYRILFRQWRIAFEIGAANRASGHAATPAGELLASVFLARGDTR